MGKMISPQNISTGVATTELKGREGVVFAKTFKHSMLLTILLGILVWLQQNVLTWMIPPVLSSRLYGRPVVTRRGALPHCLARKPSAARDAGLSLPLHPRAPDRCARTGPSAASSLRSQCLRDVSRRCLFCSRASAVPPPFSRLCHTLD
ncbi:MAG: L-lactate permease [Pararobbsia sp.]